MKPVNGAPMLGTLNGFGVSMYGRRDFDAETGTYVATRFVTLLFVPVYALGSYRVADAENGGWYFIGKEDVSGVWKTLNTAAFALIVMIIGSIWWSSHTSSPDYKQRQAIEQAEGMQKDGDIVEALTTLSEVSALDGKERENIIKLMKQYALEGVVSEDWKQARVVLEFVSQEAVIFRGDDDFISSLATATAERTADARPAAGEPAHAYIRACLKYFGKHQDVDLTAYKTKHMELLQSLAADPKAPVKYMVELATYFEEKQDAKRCKELLEPRIKELEGTEGARILGQILVGEGNIEAAYPLLSGYVIPKLDALKKATEQYHQSSDRSYNATLDHLNAGKAPQSFYDRYNKANETQQEQMVNEYAMKRMETDASYKRSVSRLQELSTVVPVAMNFGILQLRRAQAMPDKQQQQNSLKSAEKTFLSIRGIAGGDVEYQLSLGQVYYWMGKSEEGEKLFETALTSSGHSYDILYAQGSIYRELGDNQKAMDLLQKAYDKAKNDEQRHSVARTIAPICDEPEEEIKWLEKSDVNDTDVAVSLANSRGNLANRNGDTAGAEQHYLKAHGMYAKLPKSAVYLNNHSLLLQSLYAITGKSEYYKQSVSLMSEATQLMPNNSIMLSNAASLGFAGGVIDLLSEKFSPEFVKKMSSLDSLRLLYTDSASREVMRKKFLANASAKRAFQQLGSVRILSPKSDWVYSSGAAWYWMMGLNDEVAQIYQKGASLKWDENPDWKQEQKDLIEGKNDAEVVASFKQAEERAQEVRKKISDEKEWLIYQVNLVSSRLVSKYYGMDVDLKEILTTTEKAYEQHPSVFTMSAYEVVLLHTGLFELADSNPKVKKWTEAYGKIVQGGHTFFALVHSEDKKLVADVLANQHIQKYLQLNKQSVKSFPDTISVQDEYLCSLLGDEGKVSDTASSEEFRKLNTAAVEFSYHRNPYSINNVLSYYWHLKLSGKTAEAASAYAKALKDGVALPAQPGA